MRKDPYCMSIPLDELNVRENLYTEEDLIEIFCKENPKVRGFVEKVDIRIANGFLEATFVVVSE